jgi:hypothetical protein
VTLAVDKLIAGELHCANSGQALVRGQYQRVNRTMTCGNIVRAVNGGAAGEWKVWPVSAAVCLDGQPLIIWQVCM